MWQVIKQTVKPVFSGSKAAVKFWGSAVLAGIVITTVYVMTVSGGTVRYDAIAVWQNNGSGSWDIAYSIYSADNDQWTTRIALPEDGNAGEKIGTVSTLEGDDQDPDISSAKQRAIAVWSNTGASGNAGADIFYAVWGADEKGGFAWSEPRRVARLPYDDRDPTIYMPDAQNALAVWVNKGIYGEKLYFAEYKDGVWSTPQAVQMPFTLNSITGPELAFSDVNTRYLLSFTAREGGKEKPFFGVYANGVWSVARVATDFPARVDESVPNMYRTSMAVDDSMNLYTAYTGKDDSVWLYTLSANGNDTDNQASQRVSSQAVRPALLSSDGGVRVLYSEPASLSEVNESGDGKIFIAKMENGYTRIDATNLYPGAGKKSLALWSGQLSAGHDIRFSAYGSKWVTPKFIEEGYAGDDRAPAVAPIEVVVEKDGTVRNTETLPLQWNECGNGIIDDPTEACEIGVACKAANEVCDWDVFTKTMGKAGAAIFAGCVCAPIADNPDTDGADNGKKKGNGGFTFPRIPWGGGSDGRDTGGSLSAGEAFHGAACGFDQLTISKKKEDEIIVSFSPPSSSGEDETFTLNNDGSWAVTNTTGTMKIFPRADASTQPTAIVFLEIESDTVKMRGLDASSGFQLCTGEFKKGGAAAGGGLKPAPAQ